MSYGTRRRRHDLTIGDKMEIIRMLDNRSSQTDIAKLYNCSQSQISRIASKRDDILTDYENCDDPEQKKHRFSSKIEAKKPARSDGDGAPGLTDQSTSPRPPQDDQSHTPPSSNNGWLEYWKNHSSSFGRRSYGDLDSDYSPWGRQSGSAGRRGMRGRPKPSANRESRISNQMLDILKNYDLCDVYCADELALLYDAMPSREMFEEEWEDGDGERKELGGDNDHTQITVLLTCNVTGSDKRDFLVIEDSKKAEKSDVALPNCHRARAPHAWMTSDTYEEFLQALDYDMRRQRRYILLLVDNAAPHQLQAGKMLEHVRVLYIRSYTTPFFHGIFYSVRAHYRKQILLKLFANNPEMPSLAEITQKDKSSGTASVEIDLEEAVSMLHLAWKSISPQDVVQCFSKAGLCAPHIHGLPEIGGDDLPDLPEGFITDEQYEDFVNIDVDAECSGDSDLVSVECRILSDLRDQGFTDVGVEPSDDTMADGSALNTSGNSAGSGGAPMGGLRSESRIVSEDSGEVERSLSTLRSFLEQRNLHLHNLHALEAQIYSCHSGGQ